MICDCSNLEIGQLLHADWLIGRFMVDMIGCGTAAIQSDEGHVSRTSTCSSINPKPLNHHTQLYEKQSDKRGIHIYILDTEINVVPARKKK